MKFIGVILSLLFSILIGNIVGAELDSATSSYVITGVLFVASFAIPSDRSILAAYAMVDVMKRNTAMPGFQPQYNVITVFRSRDVALFPNRDDKGVKITGNVQLLQGSNMIRLEVTAGTMVWKNTAEGDADSRGIKQTLEAEVPGFALETAEFLYNNMNEDLYAIVEFCDGSTPLLFGSPCAKLQLKPEGEGNKDKTYSKLSFESMNKGPIIAHYYGTMTYAADFTISADDTTPSIAQGSGRYVIPSTNVADVTITSLDNAIEGQVITLVGSGGTHLSSIVTGGEFILHGGTSWTSLGGSTITFEVFDTDHFIELSRT